LLPRRNVRGSAHGQSRVGDEEKPGIQPGSSEQFGLRVGTRQSAAASQVGSGPGRNWTLGAQNEKCRGNAPVRISGISPVHSGADRAIPCILRLKRIQFWIEMAKTKATMFEVACPDCGAMLKIDATTGLLVSHTPAPRKRTFEDLATAAQAMREQEERKESIFRQSMDAEKNREDLMEKRFAEALRKAKDAPEGKPLREFDLD